MPTIKVYTRASCAPCKAVKMYLTRKNLQYTEVNVDSDPALMNEVISKSGFMQVPMLEIDGAVISGANFGAIASHLT